MIDPHSLLEENERLSENGDRRLQKIRKSGPGMGQTIFKLLVMLALLFAILYYHDKLSEGAAGCYVDSTGLEAESSSKIPEKATPARDDSRVIKFRVAPTEP